MSDPTSGSGPEQVKGHQRMLGLLLAAAMFVLVVDTSADDCVDLSLIFNLCAVVVQ